MELSPECALRRVLKDDVDCCIKIRVKIDIVMGVVKEQIHRRHILTGQFHYLFYVGLVSVYQVVARSYSDCATSQVVAQTPDRLLLYH